MTIIKYKDINIELRKPLINSDLISMEISSKTGIFIKSKGGGYCGLYLTTDFAKELVIKLKEQIEAPIKRKKTCKN